MPTLSSVSALLGDFPPLPRTTDAALGMPRVSVGSDRNVAFELLAEDLRKIHPHLQFETSDDLMVRQIKTLSAENLVLRQQAEVNLSNSLIEGKHQVTTPNLLTGVHSESSFRSPGNSGKAVNVNPSPPKWSDMVNQGCDNSRMKLFYQPPIIREARVVVCPPDGIIDEGVSRWSGCVVGYFLDKGLPYTSVRNIATNIWKKYGIEKVLSNEHGFFFFKFNQEDAFRKLLENGPWHFGGKLLVLKKWSPQMTLVKEQLIRIPIWVHLYNVPLELWSAAGLSFIASAIGIPLYADRFTETAQRLSYARICVEIEVGAEFVDSVDVMYTDGTEVTVGVKYPWRPARCLDCHVFGHSTQQCGKKVGVTKTAWVAKEVGGKSEIAVMPEVTPVTAWVAKEVGRKSEVAAVPEVTPVLEGVSIGGLDSALVLPGIVGRVGLDGSGECGPSTQPVGSLGMGDSSFQPVLVDSYATFSPLARNKSAQPVPTIASGGQEIVNACSPNSFAVLASTLANDLGEVEDKGIQSEGDEIVDDPISLPVDCIDKVIAPPEGRRGRGSKRGCGGGPPTKKGGGSNKQ